MLFPDSGAGWRSANHSSLLATKIGERFGFPVQTDTYDGGSKPEIRELLRFVSTVPHSLPKGGRCAQDVSARRLKNTTFIRQTFMPKTS